MGFSFPSIFEANHFPPKDQSRAGLSPSPAEVLDSGCPKGHEELDGMWRSGMDDEGDGPGVLVSSLCPAGPLHWAVFTLPGAGGQAANSDLDNLQIFRERLANMV